MGFICHRISPPRPKYSPHTSIKNPNVNRRAESVPTHVTNEDPQNFTQDFYIGFCHVWEHSILTPRYADASIETCDM